MAAAMDNDESDQYEFCFKFGLAAHPVPVLPVLLGSLARLLPCCPLTEAYK